MKKRDWLLAATSCVAGALFLLLAVKAGKLDFSVTVAQLRSASPVPVAMLLLLTAFHIFLSAQKWRCVDAALRTPADGVPSMRVSYGMTAVGVALGQVLPLQIGVVTARTIGAQCFGRGLSRGTLGSIFEQGFDVVIMALLAVASCVTVLSHGGAVTWTLVGGCMVTFAFFAAKPVVGWIHRIALSAAGPQFFQWRIARQVVALCNAGFLNPLLARKLIILSAARFVVQVLMAQEVSLAIGAQIPIWHLAASIPLVILACVIVLTPGGIGISELSFAGVLHVLGTPVHTGAQWALASRVLISSSCFVVAAMALVVLGIAKLRPNGESKAARGPKIMDEQPSEIRP